MHPAPGKVIEKQCQVATVLGRRRTKEVQQLNGATIHSVTFGILGVAVIQSVFAALGFLVVGLPAVGLWTVIFLFATVVQAGVFVLVPAVIYVLATASITKAVVFLVWCAIVGVVTFASSGLSTNTNTCEEDDSGAKR